MNYLTREEAIEKVGINMVDFVDSLGCVNSERVLDNQDTIGFIVIIDLMNSKYDTLTVFYKQDVLTLKLCENLDKLDWEVYGYKLD